LEQLSAWVQRAGWAAEIAESQLNYRPARDLCLVKQGLVIIKTKIELVREKKTRLTTFGGKTKGGEPRKRAGSKRGKKKAGYLGSAS